MIATSSRRLRPIGLRPTYEVLVEAVQPELGEVGEAK
jgi:hypothetical protein